MDRTKGAATIDKGLSLFLDVLQSDGVALSQLADRARIPSSTAQRIVGALMRQGLLSRTGRGRYAAGLRLAELAALGDTRSVLAGASRPVLQQLAHTLGATVHLGVLEGDMVTYLVKEHGGGPHLRTREANQLEAYCSAIGKVLLAALDERSRNLYFAAGAFVRLTANTMTEVVDLRQALRLAAQCGHAADRAEFEEGLYCLAVPVAGPGGRVVAALSASSGSDHCDDPSWLRHLERSADRIGRRLGACGPWPSTANPDTTNRL